MHRSLAYNIKYHEVYHGVIMQIRVLSETNSAVIIYYRIIYFVYLNIGKFLIKGSETPLGMFV